MPTSHRTIKWIENLAEQELLIHEGERASIDILTTKDEVLALETSSFVRDLYHHFDYLIRLFNARVSNAHLQIKFLRQSDASGGFSLIRNARRLLLSKHKPGILHVQCDKFTNGNAIGHPLTSLLFSASVEARFGIFHDVEWYFLGSRVTAEQMARHYLTEFLQVSREPSEQNQ